MKQQKKKKVQDTVRKLTLRDKEGVLDQADNIRKALPFIPSLNSYVIEAIKSYNKKLE